MAKLLSLKTISILVFGVLAAGFLSGTVLLYLKVWNPAWNPFKPAPQEAIAQAATAMEKLQALKADLNFEFNFQANSQEPLKILGNIVGARDKTGVENFQSHIVSTKNYYSSSGSRAKDARIMSAMGQMRTVATAFAANFGTYNSFSCESEGMLVLCDEISRQTGKEPTIFAQNNKFCAFSSLSVPDYFYCIDSEGYALTTNNPQKQGYCDGKTFNCPTKEVEIPQEARESADEGGDNVKKEEFSWDFQTIKSGNDNYLKFNFVLPAEYEDYFSYGGLDYIFKIKNQWLKTSFKDFLREIMGRDISEKEIEQGIGPLVKLKEAAGKKFKELVKNKEFYIVKNKLQDEKLGGETNERYVLALNKEMLKGAIKELQDELGQGSIISGSLLGFPAASSRAKDARIMSAMRQMRTVATAFGGNYGTYNGFSCESEDMPVLCAEVAKQTGKALTIFAQDGEFCAFSPLTILGYYYCIDGQGYAGTVKNPQVAGYCDGRTFNCPESTEISQEDREKTQKEQEEKEMDEFFHKADDFIVEVWLGKEKGLISRVKGQRGFDLRDGKGKIDLSFSCDFSTDQALKIELPQDAKTLDQVFMQSVPQLVYPADNSEIHTIAPPLFFDRGVGADYYLVAFWQGDKTSISQDDKDWLTWARVDSFSNEAEMLGPVGKFQWNETYSGAVKACRDKELSICSDWGKPVRFTIKPGTGSYQETDKGKDYYTKGTVISSQNAQGIVIKGYTVKEPEIIGMRDECLSQKTGKESDRDILIEYYKTGNPQSPVKQEQYKCLYGCADGACLKSSK